MYNYEMHQHTSGCSLCGAVTPEDMVKSVKENGFSGVVLTNHFYHGNTAIDRNLPWEDFCKAYEEEYMAAKTAGDEIGVDVIYGLEEGVGDGKEVLIYGISPDTLAKYPELKNIDLEFLSKVVREAGGILVQAHPYRERNWIKNVDKPLPCDLIDGYEGYNKGNTKEENAKAVALAKENNMLITAGSDCHSYRGKGRFGISSPKRITNEKELAEVLKSGNYELLHNEDEE